MTKMNRGGWSMLVVLSLACARDRSITRGAEGSHDWQRTLEAVVPLGTSIDSARSFLIVNGFDCPLNESTDSSTWCEKHSGGRLGIVRRTWKAHLLSQSGRVTKVEGVTGLTGP